MNPDDTEETVDVTDEEMMAWIEDNPDLASEALALALDRMADSMGRSQAARLFRVIATDAWKVHMNIIGHDALEFVEDESKE